MKNDFLLAFNEIAEVRKLPRETILDALKVALVSAYRRNAGIGSGQHVDARIDEAAGTLSIWVEKEVVTEVASPPTEVTVEEARKYDPEAQAGDMVTVESTPEDFGRIAAQTAKQVILQRMREAERDAQYEEYIERVGDLITGTVQSNTNGTITLGLGRTEAIMPRSQQMPNERYQVHDKVRAYVMDVHKSSRGPQIVVSRTHRNMLRRLLEYEVPEIYNGTVEIKSIAREPGARSKVAVAALREGADPVGACVGMRGARIQNIVKELNNEKIDVIEWNPDPTAFIAKSLSPARVSGVFLDDDPSTGRTAVVVVPEDQLSLAIGREGQNARLGAKLTGWRIDIKSVAEAAQETLAHIREEGMEELAATFAESILQIEEYLNKRAENRAIQPEEYQKMIEFIRTVETQRVSILEAGRAERRAHREEARARVPAAAFSLLLEDTSLPPRVASNLAESGFGTVGQIMEQYYLDPATFMGIPGLGAGALEAIEKLLATIDFTPKEEVTAEVSTTEIAAEATGEAGPLAVQVTDSAAETVPPAGQPDETLSAEDFARAQRAALVAQLSGVEAPAESKADQVPTSGTAAPESEAITAEMINETEEEEVGLAYPSESAEGDDESKRSKSKQRRIELVFDEQRGMVVAKRKRKPGRSRGTWDDGLEGESEE